MAARLPHGGGVMLTGPWHVGIGREQTPPAARARTWAARSGTACVALIGASALFYSTVQPGRLRLLLAAAFLLVVGFAAFTRRRRLGATLSGVATTALIVWYVQDRPSNSREWTPEHAVAATTFQDGQSVEVRHIRNFVYSTEVEFTSAYYDATFPLDGLATVDLVASYWSGDAIAHVFMTFGFDDGRHLAVSVETRRQVDARYSEIAGFFHHYELIYVVADERDLIGVRTDIRGERVYLYRLSTTAQQRQALFLSTMDRVEQLARRPEWYNSLTDNCTTGILARSNSLLDIPYDWRALLSGYAPEYAYSLGLLDTSRSFADLHDQSLIRRPPGSRIARKYSQEIRQGLPLDTLATAH